MALGDCISSKMSPSKCQCRTGKEKQKKAKAAERRERKLRRKRLEQETIEPATAEMRSTGKKPAAPTKSSWETVPKKQMPVKVIGATSYEELLKG